MSNVDINVDRRTDGRKIGRLYRTLLLAGAIKIKVLQALHHVQPLHLHQASAITLSKIKSKGRCISLSLNSISTDACTGVNFGYVQCSKSNHSKRRQTRVTVHVFCKSPHSAFTFVWSCVKILSGLEYIVEMAIFSIYDVQRATTPKVVRVMVFVYCTWSHGALHLWEISI